ncbi:MAG: FAD-dependent oxidoreductase [Lachnospiraceae bacterium]|nr:FAD-dependent oxidoreductase [Lachnospiraceae bacterium]
MESVWQKTVTMPKFERLQGDVSTDVLIIGGGITGILCAYFLQERGIDCLLLEGNEICQGVTGKTTAKITAQHGLVYAKLIKRAGLEKARLYLEANQKAVLKYAELAKRIPCDFEEKTAYVYSVDNRKKLEQEAEAYRMLGLDDEITDTTELPFPTAGAVRMRQQAQFHPLKFLAGIAKGLNIYEHSFVTQLMPGRAVTEQGSVTYHKAIFTTHFPIDNKHGAYFLKLYQHRSYVIALEQAARIEGMYVDEAKKGMSFREYENLLLIGGGSHRTGKKGGDWQELRDFAKKYYPNAVEKYHWATQDCMPLDYAPYIGVYSPAMPDCYVATGFRKWGMTSAMVSAMVLTDMVQEIENPYAEVFRPLRSILTGQLICNCAESVCNILTPTVPRCPHLGCALKWNKTEHSWDCPCHGSRFAEDGKLLDNPANGDNDKTGWFW